MTTYVITAPDGKEYEIDAPQGATQEQALAYFQANWKPAPKLQVDEAFKQRSAASMARAESPILATAADTLAGATSVLRGGMNIVGKAFAGSQWGDKIFPTTAVDKTSGAYLAGEIADPYAMVVGGGAGTAAKFIPRAGTFVRNVAGGAMGGGAVGALTDEGDAGTGAVMGGVVGGAMPLAGRMIGKAADTITGRGADIRTGRMLREAGADATTLRGAGPDLNVAQAMGVNAPAEVSALQEIARTRNPNVADKLLKQQDAARRAAMERVAGGGSAEEAAAARSAAQKVLGKQTDPERVIELNAANEANKQLANLAPAVAQKRASEIAALQNAGQAETISAQQKYLGENFAPVPGQPRFPSRYAPQTDRAGEFADTAADFANIKAQRLAERQFIERKIGALEAHGLRPLTADPIIETIRNRLSQPGDRATSLVQKTLGEIEDAITKAAQANGGVLDAYDLHAIRKYEINSVIENLVKDASKSDKTRASKLAGEVKSAIDNAIENAGGTGWKTYLNKYTMGMRSVDQMAMGQVAKDLSPKQLIKLVAGDKPKMVEKVFGPGQRSFTEAMGEKAAPFQRAAGELERDLELAKKAASGQVTGKEILDKNLLVAHLPNLLRQDISLLNRAISWVGDKVNKSTLDKLAKVMYDPAEAAKVIETLPAYERNAILRAMQDPTVTGAAAGMMTGASQ